jgi:hypothetical protein
MNLRRIFITVAVLALLPGCRSREEVVIPPELVGTWKTGDARYADRFFELTAHTLTLTLGRGEDGSETYAIRSIKKSQDDRGTLYAVSYMNYAEKVEDVLAFYYDPRGGGTIRFKNQPGIVWVKEKPEP